MNNSELNQFCKVRDTEIKWSIISKSVTVIIFVEFIDQLIDYPINCASLSKYMIWFQSESEDTTEQYFPALSLPSVLSGYATKQGAKVKFQ